MERYLDPSEVTRVRLGTLGVGKISELKLQEKFVPCLNQNWISPNALYLSSNLFTCILQPFIHTKFLVGGQPRPVSEYGWLVESLWLSSQKPCLSDELHATLDREAAVQDAQLLEDQHPTLRKPAGLKFNMLVMVSIDDNIL